MLRRRMTILTDVNNAMLLLIQKIMKAMVFPAVDFPMENPS